MMLSLALVLLSLMFMPGGSQTQAPAGQQAASPIAEELWAAARAGDAARVTAALDKGADVNAKTRYGATALTFAADRGHVDIVKLLIGRGADVNVQDTFYQMRAVDMAMMNKHPDVVTLLLERGSKGAPGILQQAIQSGNVPLVATALKSPELTRAHLRPALAGAKKVNNPEIIALVEKKLAELPAEPATAAVTVDRATLQSYVGSYRNEEAGAAITIALNGEQLMLTPPGGGGASVTLVANSPTSFRVAEREGLTINFEGAWRHGRAPGRRGRQHAAGVDSRRHAGRGSGGTRNARSAGAAACTGPRTGGQTRGAHGGKKLARVPRRERRRQWRRSGSGSRVGRRYAAEHPLEDGDPRHLERQSRGLGRPRLRRHGRQ